MSTTTPSNQVLPAKENRPRSSGKDKDAEKAKKKQRVNQLASTPVASGENDALDTIDTDERVGLENESTAKGETPTDGAAPADSEMQPAEGTASSTALVTAADTRVGQPTSLAKARKNARNKLASMYGSQLVAKPEATGGGSPTSNLVAVTGYVLAVHQYRSNNTKKKGDQDTVKPDHDTFTVLVTQLENTGGRSHVFSGTPDDPSTMFVIPTKIEKNTDTAASGGGIPADHRYFPDCVRFDAPLLAYLKFNVRAPKDPANPPPNYGWEKKIASGMLVRFSGVEFSISAKSNCDTGRVYYNVKGSGTPIERAGVGTQNQEATPFSATNLMKELLDDSRLNKIAFDRFVDAFDSFEEILYGPKLSMMDEADALVGPDHPVFACKTDVVARAEKRPAIVAKGLRHVVKDVDPQYDVYSTAKKFLEFADAVEEKKAGSTASLLEIPSPQSFVLLKSTNASRHVSLAMQGEEVKLPDRFLEVTSFNTEIVEGKAGTWIKCMAGVVLVPDSSRAVSMLEKGDEEGFANYCKIASPPEEASIQSRFEVMLELGHVAQHLGIVSSKHMEQNASFLLSHMQFVTPFSKNSKDFRPGLINGFANVFVCDMPSALRDCGVPVSFEWIVKHLCKGRSLFPGMPDVFKPDSKTAVQSVDPEKNNAHPEATMKKHGFFNLTEYRAGTDETDVIYDVPEGSTVRFVAVLASESVYSEMQHIKNRLELGEDEMLDDNDGEDLLAQECSRCSYDSMTAMIEDRKMIIYAVAVPTPVPSRMLLTQ